MADEDHGRCQTCRHRRDGQCALTNAHLPEVGGCCHWNVALIEGPVPVTPAMVAPLAGFFELTRKVLADFPHQLNHGEWIIPDDYVQELEALGIEYRPDPAGLRVDPERLVLVVEEPVADILAWLDAPYHRDGELVWVDPEDLAVPTTCYGQGTEF